MKLTISNLQKRTISQTGLKALAKKILLHEKIRSGFLSIVLVNDRAIRRLNRQFLSRNRPTDVLAFEFSSWQAKKQDGLRGEIIISTDTAKRNAAIFKSGFQREIKLYLIHGILHLMGFDDSTGKDTALMRRKETELLNRFAR